jgi:hypothetical protein
MASSIQVSSPKYSSFVGLCGADVDLGWWLTRMVGAAVGDFFSDLTLPLAIDGGEG